MPKHFRFFSPSHSIICAGIYHVQSISLCVDFVFIHFFSLFFLPSFRPLLANGWICAMSKSPTPNVVLFSPFAFNTHTAITVDLFRIWCLGAVKREHWEEIHWPIDIIFIIFELLDCMNRKTKFFLLFTLVMGIQRNELGIWHCNFAPFQKTFVCVWVCACVCMCMCLCVKTIYYTHLLSLPIIAFKYLPLAG